MAGEWVERSISDLGDVVGGSTPSTADPSNFDGDVPWLTPKDLSGSHNRYVRRGDRNLTAKGLASCSAQLLPANSVLLSSRAPIGYVAIAANPIATNQGFRSLVLKKEYDHEFIYYWLKANVDELERHSSGSTFKELSGSAYKQIRLVLPSDVNEQRAVAHILGTLDDKIELNRRINETLEAIARVLFQSLFVDFDPVRAKAEGRDPGLPQPLADLFPDSFEDSELGKIPRGWELRRFGALLADSIGGDWGKEAPDEVHTEPVAVIRGTDIPDVWSGGVGKVPTRYTTRNRLDGRRLQDGDIIIEVSGGSPTQPTGRSMLVSQEILDRFPIDVVCASFCRRFRPVTRTAGILGSQHLAWLYSTGGTWEYQNQSTGIANFQTTRFLGSEMVVWPGDQLADQYVRFVESIFQKSSTNESLTLTALRDALLPKLIAGELRVEDPARFLGGGD